MPQPQQLVQGERLGLAAISTAFLFYIVEISRYN